MTKLFQFYFHFLIIWEFLPSYLILYILFLVRVFTFRIGRFMRSLLDPVPHEECGSESRRRKIATNFALNQSAGSASSWKHQSRCLCESLFSVVRKNVHLHFTGHGQDLPARTEAQLVDLGGQVQNNLQSSSWIPRYFSTTGFTHVSPAKLQIRRQKSFDNNALNLAVLGTKYCIFLSFKQRCRAKDAENNF